VIVIRISGGGAGPGAGPAAFAGTTTFLAHAGLVRSLEEDALAARVAARTAGAHGALVWVNAQGEVTAVPYGADLRVLRPLRLPHGLTLDTGSTVHLDNPAEVVIRPAGAGAAPVRLPLEGPAAGALHYTGAVRDEASIRYFHPQAPVPGGGAGASPAFGAFRFRIFPAAATPIPVHARHDPARPFDPAHSLAVPLASDPRPSGFRTRWGSVVHLAGLPRYYAYVPAWDPALQTAYTTVKGLWAWSVEGAGADDAVELIPGLSGAEYVRAPASWVLRFVAGAPAYAHRFGAAKPAEGGALVDRAPGVEHPVTTAWVYVQAPPTGAGAGPADGGTAGYYSQPERAGLFTPEREFLRSLSLQAAPLPPDPDPGAPLARSFPAVPYAGVQPSEESGPRALDRLRAFEREVLAAVRTGLIYAIPGDGPRGPASSPAAWPLSFAGGQGGGLTGPSGPTGPGGPTGPSGPVETSVTPQGMRSAFSRELDEWRELVLARNAGQPLAYTDVRGKLREALLASQLFLVVSDPAKLYEYCSTRYRVTPGLAPRLAAQGAPREVLAAAGRLAGIEYHSRGYFLPELQRLLQDQFDRYRKAFLDDAEVARITVGGWTFDLASAGWKKEKADTLLILKFCDGGLREVAGDLSRWTLPDAFNATPAETQTRLLEFLDQAETRARTEPELQPFVDTVLGRGWNGVLYLNAPVPTNVFPPEIAALAAGLPAGPLRAHHLGVTLSPFRVANGAVHTADSSLFGLILYDDPRDLVFQGAPYDFKVMSLRVRFANSAVASFTSQVQLLVARLFGELADLRDSTRGNNLLLDGTLQNGAYRFASASRSPFDMQSHVLEQVTVSRARFVTLPRSVAGRTVARFILDGSMGFLRLGDFDLFGFGAGKDGDGGELAFSGLVVSMDFDPANPSGTRSFGFVAGEMSLDAGGSRARVESLPRRFPLRAAAMRQGGRVTDAQGKQKTAMPPDLGFIPVESPLGDGGLGQEWYGLEMTLSFGSPGALAPSLGFSGALLAAWAPAAAAPNVSVGIRLPGSEGGKKSLTVMGPLKLGIGRLNFLFDPATRGYLLRLQNVALSFLGLSFPPGGRTNALLFGDPDPRASNAALGWYLAYKKDKKKDDKKKDDKKELAALAPARAPAAPDPECAPCREAAARGKAP
jgi:hypothetical protein